MKITRNLTIAAAAVAFLWLVYFINQVIAFLLSVGVLRREWSALVVSAAVLVLYGGAVQSLLAYTPGTSWSGHFFGFVSGMLAAWWTKKERAM